VIRCSLVQGGTSNKMKGWIPTFGEWRISYLVVLADAGTHTSWQRWIPAFAESTPRLEQKGSGGNDRTLGE
jgi:hypothetical protein